jgi:hypothetical protein
MYPVRVVHVSEMKVAGIDPVLGATAADFHSRPMTGDAAGIDHQSCS